MPEALSGAPQPATLAERVIVWQARHGRHGLPWQGTRDPYRVWLSEVMLQQTQVTTVLGYYGRFLDRFPDVTALAAAPLDEVLALWSGLGYYSRARNLHRCAQAVVAQHGGRFPQDSATLATLPGIGRSTAAAIAAFCAGERVAILDGNVKRVLARVLGFEADLAERRHELALWEQAQALLPEQGMGAYTQGLMDLGAGVCTRRQPQCTRCPLQEPCVAHAQGLQAALPVKSRRLKRGRRTSVLLVLRQGSRVWLVQRPATGVWAGLWCLPEQPVPAAGTAEAAGVVAEPGLPASAAPSGTAPAPDWPGASAWPGHGEPLPAIHHALTHFDWELRPFTWQLPPRMGAAARDHLCAAFGPGRWVELQQALDLGLPAPVRRILAG